MTRICCLHSKSLLKPACCRATIPLCTRNHCSSLLQSHNALKITARACCKATFHSKSLLEPAAEPLCIQNHCSSLLQSHFAFKITARACVFKFDVTARLRTVLCSPSQAPSGAICESSRYIYIYICIFDI